MKRKLQLLLGLGLVLIFGGVQAQVKTVTGKVTSSDDRLSIPGVSVVIKGTSKGVQTNSDGGYSIQASASDVLVFSFIGMTSVEETVGNRSVVNVVMETEGTELTEITITTAMGQERKRNQLAYAAQQVTSKEITEARNPNLMSALAGKVAGLQIKQNNTMGGSVSTILRGYKSITGNNQALYVIDGVPVTNHNSNTANQQTGRAGADYGNAASDINPDNIESISVLKGAAASALYGSRASNGVILITTKKGRRNSMDVTVNSGLTWGKMDKSTYARYQKEYGAGYESGFYEGDLGSGEGPIALFDADASYGTKFDRNLMVYQWDAFDPSSPTYGKMTPWVAGANGPDKFFETALTSNQSINLSGGNDKATFNLGYTRTDEKGLLPNSFLDKNMFSFGSTYNISTKFSVGATANFTNVKGTGRYGTGYDGKNPNQQFRQWFQTNIDLLDLKSAYFRNRQNVTWNWADPYAPFSENHPIYSDNPYWTRYENYSNDTRNNFFGSTYATYKVASWLDLTGKYSYNGVTDFQEERIAVGSSDPSAYARYNRDFFETNVDFLANFRKALTSNIFLSGLVGSNMRRSKLNSVRASTSTGLVVPKLYSLSNSVGVLVPPVEFQQWIGVDGVFANVNLGYKNLANLDMSIRRDKSTTLPKGSNTYYYPAIGANFVISEMPILSESRSWLSLAKVRANFAQTGSDAPVHSVYDVYDKPTALGSTPLFSLPNTKNNPDLKPEITKSIEFGIEAEFIQSRFGIDFTWYKTNTLDQIIPVSISSATGYTSRFINSGEMQNKGIEISTFLTPIKTPDFSWTVNANFTRNRNLVLSLYQPENSAPVTNIVIASLQGGVTINAGLDPIKNSEGVITGYKPLPFGVIKGTDFVYVNGEKVVRPNGYYMASSSATEVIGNPHPDWMAGISNSLKYRNFGMSFLVDIKKGGDVWSLDQYYGEGTGLYEETAGLNDKGIATRLPVSEGGGIKLPGVQADGSPNTVYGENSDGNGNTVYGYANGGNPRAMYIYDGSFVKLREVALSYTLPASLVDRLNAFKGIEVSLIGRNLWIIHKNMKYSDPEDGLSSGTLSGAGGYQSGAYPATKTYGFNVKLRF
jgi:TonB-linked SusC/RagA family outer membrane protein